MSLKRKAFYSITENQLGNRILGPGIFTLLSKYFYC